MINTYIKVSLNFSYRKCRRKKASQFASCFSAISFPNVYVFSSNLSKSSPPSENPHALSERCCVSGTPGATGYTARRNMNSISWKTQTTGLLELIPAEIRNSTTPHGLNLILSTKATPSSTPEWGPVMFWHWAPALAGSEHPPISKGSQYNSGSEAKQENLTVSSPLRAQCRASSMCCRSIQPHYLRSEVPEELGEAVSAINSSGEQTCSSTCWAHWRIAPLPPCGRARLQIRPAPASQPPAQALGMSKAKQAFCTSPVSVGFCPPSTLSSWVLSEAEEFLK